MSIKRINRETVWESIPEYQKKMLDKEDWCGRWDEVFEKLLSRESSVIFVAEDKEQPNRRHCRC